MWFIKEEAALYRTPSDITHEFTKLADIRRDEGCCQGVDGLIDSHCGRCKTRWMHLRRVQLAVDKIFSGEVTWGHCEEAARRLKTIAEMPMPKMEEKSCECSPRKTMRVY